MFACGSNVQGPVGGVPGSASRTGSGGGGGNGSNGEAIAELEASTFSARGGAAVSPGGRGEVGGGIHARSLGAVSMGPASLPPSGTVASPPPTATAVRAEQLAADVTLDGTTTIGDVAVPPGADAVRRIAVRGGDLYVTGSLRAADAGAARQGIALSALDGKVFVTGTVDTSGGTPGQAGGPIEIAALDVVILGALTAHGADGEPAGGAGGSVRVTANTDVTVGGTIRCRGGGSSGKGAGAPGGAAGQLAIDAAGAVFLGGPDARFDLRGGFGSAAASGGAVVGGRGGAVQIGETGWPSALTFAFASVDTGGGDGFAAAGAGGAIEIQGAGDFTVSGRVRTTGGSIAPGGAGDGGTGGDFSFDNPTTTGGQVVAASAEVTLDGGDSGGPGRAGGGGYLRWRSANGDVSIAGKLRVRGGTARDPGGEGGAGGRVYVFSDYNYDGIGGNLTVQAEGILDASGGAGTIGGSARNDGTAGVALFPEGLDRIAVLLNSDSAPEELQDGQLQNLGQVIARGGAGNGSGGDVIFHGRQLGNSDDPVPGRVSSEGDGSGQPGQYSSQ
jgi:hypothetical protein